jgi:hypothetical protein
MRERVDKALRSSELNINPQNDAIKYSLASKKRTSTLKPRWISCLDLMIVLLVFGWCHILPA